MEAYDPVTGWGLVEQRNHMKVGQEIEVFQPKGDTFRQCIEELQDDEGTPIAAAPHPQQKIRIRMRQPVIAGAIIRRPLVKEES